jgi:predicted LPLAT superfamily acyltransferase
VHIYRLFISQGKQLIDRYAMISKVKMFDIQVSGHDQFMNIIHNSQKGVILLTSHFGNWQIAMATLSKLNKTVYLLMRPEDNLAVQDSLQITRDHANIKVISIKQDLGGVIEIMNLLKEGQIVSIMGDRSYGSRTVEVSFLGAKAWFPYGAFTIAAAIGSPMVVLLSAKEASYQHVVDVSNILYPCYNGKQHKQQQLRQWVQDFAALLETYVARYPYQCFLFHDIWRKGTGEPIQEDGNVRSQEMKHQ